MDAAMGTAGNPENPANMPGQPQASAPPQMYGQSSGGALFKLKCIWLFILGAVLAVIGLFCFLYRPDMGETNPFIIMLMGLFFTAAGSIYGKRKLRGEAAVMVPVGQQPLQTQFLQPLQELGIPASQLTQPQPVPAVAAPPAEAKIIKIFVCPKCGAENEMGDKFCYKCGNKFVKPKKRAAKTRKQTKAAKERAAAKLTPEAAKTVKNKPAKKTKSKKQAKEEAFA